MNAHSVRAPLFDAEDLGPARIARTGTHRLRSEAIGQDFLLEVAWPMAPVDPGEKVPVVYVLDGNQCFAMTAQVARMLQYGPFPLPKAFVVGIGYHGGGPEGLTPAMLRMRDLTPCGDAMVEARFRDAPPEWRLPPEVAFGGADAFLAFIEEQVKPFVADRYPVDPDDQGLIGVSAGGLFALNALFTRPGAFRRIVAISPALYWGERRLFELEAALAKRTADLPVDLFLAVGGLEEAHDPQARMVSSLYEMEAVLRARGYPGLRMSMEVFPGETHMSVFPAAVSRGVSQVFGGPGDTHDWMRVVKG